MISPHYLREIYEDAEGAVHVPLIAYCPKCQTRTAQYGDYNDDKQIGGRYCHRCRTRVECHPVAIRILHERTDMERFDKKIRKIDKRDDPYRRQKTYDPYEQRRLQQTRVRR